MVRLSPAVAMLVVLFAAGAAVTTAPEASACTPWHHECISRCAEADNTFDSCRDSQQNWAEDGVEYLVGVLGKEETVQHMLAPGQSYAPGAEGAIYVRAQWADGQKRVGHNATFAITAFDESLTWLGRTDGTFSFNPANGSVQELLFRFRVKPEATSDRAAVPFQQMGPSGSHADALRVAIEQRQPGSLFGLSPDLSLGLMVVLGFLLAVVVLRVMAKPKASPPSPPPPRGSLA